MSKYPTQFGLEENEPMVFDPGYISSDESNSTPCSSPEHYFTAHSSDEHYATNQLMIIHREETADCTQPPNVHVILNLSISMVDETFAD